MEEHTRREALAVVIDRLETTLREADEWEEQPPPDRLLGSQEPFCYDTLTFRQWVQWRMIPRMRSILDHHEPLPQSSAILAYAEEFVEVADPHRQRLLRLIRRFDELISA